MDLNQPNGKCLNCGHETSGKFCSNCGQKTNIPHEGFWHMLVHFVADYFHYDGKFWATLKMLLTSPGKLSTMYILGKRASYLKPIQLYIFISAVFFIVFFKVVYLVVIKNGDKVNATFKMSKAPPENLSNTEFNRQLDTLKILREKRKKDEQELDSILASLGPGLTLKRIGGLTAKKAVNYANRKKLYTGGDFAESILSTFFHSIPKLFFFLMPILALLLKLFFRKREYVYVDHAVMSLHLHSFMFISFLLGCLLGFIEWDNDVFDIGFIMVIPLLYFFIAFRNFYKTSWIMTILKGIFTIAFYLFVVLVAGLTNLLLLIWFG